MIIHATALWKVRFLSRMRLTVLGTHCGKVVYTNLNIIRLCAHNWLWIMHDMLLWQSSHHLTPFSPPFPVTNFPLHLLCLFLWSERWGFCRLEVGWERSWSWWWWLVLWQTTAPPGEKDAHYYGIVASKMDIIVEVCNTLYTTILIIGLSAFVTFYCLNWKFYNIICVNGFLFAATTPYIYMAAKRDLTHPFSSFLIF